ncbi:unnamed protein product [Closterium sp. NIES-54]
MASLRILALDHESRPIQFDTWLGDLKLYLLSDSWESVSLFDHTSGAAPAPPATADSATRSQWLTHEAAAHLAICNHLPLAKCAHFGQHRTAQALYDAIVARYSSPATASLGRLLLPYLFPEMSAFATLEDLVSHLRTSDARYRAAAPADVVTVGAARGTPHTPFFEGCSPSPIAPPTPLLLLLTFLVLRTSGLFLLVRSATAARARVAGVVAVAAGLVVGAAVEVVEVVEVVMVVGVVARVGALVVAVVAAVGVAVVAAMGVVEVRLELLSVEVLVVARGSSSSVGARPRRPSSFMSGFLAVGRLGAEGDCYRCEPPDLGIEAAALGAGESALPGTAPAEALHTFTLDSVLTRSSTILSCPAVPSGSLLDLHLPSFSTNLVSTAALQDAMVTTTIPGGQRVSICTCTRTGRHLATFTRRPGLSLYTLATEPSPVAASAQVSASDGMHSRLLASGLPRSLPPLPPSPAPPCLPCVEGRQRAAPQSSSFPPTIAPLQTLRMDVKGEVPDVLIAWIRAVRLQLRERFRQDLPVLRLHSDRGGEFSSDFLRDFCHGEGILQSFTLPASPQKNGIAKRRIGLVMELNLWPRVSLPETSPTLRWTREVGDASVFRVWGSRAFVRDTSADKLSTRAIPCVFLGFPPDAPGWQFYHPTSRRVSPTQDVTFDESVPFYRLFPYRSALPPPPPLFLAPGPPPIDPLAPQGPAPSGVSQVDPLHGTVPVEVVVDSSAARGAAYGGAASGGAEPGGAEYEGAGSGGAEPGGPVGASLRLSPRLDSLSPQQLREWFTQRTRLQSGAAGAGDSAAGDAGAGGAGVTAGAGCTGGAAAADPGDVCTRGTRAAGSGCAGSTGGGDPTEHGAAGARRAGARAGGAGAVGVGAGGTGAGGAGPGGAGAVDPGARGAMSGGTGTRGTPASTLPAPSPFTEQTGGLTERRETASPPTYPVRAVRTGRRVPRPRHPPVPGTHAMALRPFSFPLRVPLPPPPESSLTTVPDPESDLACVTGGDTSKGVQPDLTRTPG